MKKLSLLSFAIVLMLCPLLLLPFVGCESSSSDDDVATNTNSVAVFTIDPQSVTLTASNTPSQTFTASGGTPAYAWEVDDTTLGTLNKAIGDTVIYTAKTNTGANVLRAEDGDGNVATAVITQE